MLRLAVDPADGRLAASGGSSSCCLKKSIRKVGVTRTLGKGTLPAQHDSNSISALVLARDGPVHSVECSLPLVAVSSKVSRVPQQYTPSTTTGLLSRNQHLIV